MLAATLVCTALGVMPIAGAQAPQAPQTPQAPTTPQAPQIPQAPQGVSLTLAPRSLPSYPNDLAMSTTHPFADKSGQPVDAPMAAAGDADLDGDRHRDLWFLAASGPHRGRISLQMARTSSLGRFRAWHMTPAGVWVDAATYRSKSHSADRLVLVAPNSSMPTMLAWNRKSVNSDPREGSLGGGASGWTMGFGSYEIEARDDAGDGHDDITALQRLGNGHTRVKKLNLSTRKYNFLWPESVVQVTVPAGLSNLRMFDYDGDGRSDFVAVVNGLGVLVGRDNGFGAFDAAAFWPIPSGIRDLAIGDIQNDGRDDLAICFDGGILVMVSGGAGFSARALINPTGLGRLGSTAIVDVDGRGTAGVMGFPADGRGYVFHDALDIVRNQWNPVVLPGHAHWSSQTFAGLRNGVDDSNVLVLDVDNDRDQDVLLRTPDRLGFMTLRNPLTSLAPTAATPRYLLPLPASESTKGAMQEIRVKVPQALMGNFPALEAAVFAPDPDSANMKDPDYIYWGRVLPWIQQGQDEAVFRVWAWQDEKAWHARVRSYKKLAKIGGKTDPLVYPNEPWAIRVGPKCYLSLHGYNGGLRAESSVIEWQDPSKSKSTLGPRWVLRAYPPTPKADRNLLPWE